MSTTNTYTQTTNDAIDIRIVPSVEGIQVAIQRKNDKWQNVSVEEAKAMMSLRKD